MIVISMVREVNPETLDPEIFARLVFSIDDIPSNGEYAYRCRVIGEKILEALEIFKVKKNG